MVSLNPFLDHWTLFLLFPYEKYLAVLQEMEFSLTPDVVLRAWPNLVSLFGVIFFSLILDLASQGPGIGQRFKFYKPVRLTSGAS